MLVLIWTILGIALGVVWELITGRNSLESFASVILTAVSGAVTGGLLFTLFGTTGWAMINFYNLIVSIAGALTFLVARHSIKQAINFPPSNIKVPDVTKEK